MGISSVNFAKKEILKPEKKKKEIFNPLFFSFDVNRYGDIRFFKKIIYLLFSVLWQREPNPWFTINSS